jgi:hypothetical protein
MSQSPPFPSEPIDNDDPEPEAIEVPADDSEGAPRDTPGDKKGGKGTFVAALVSALASLLTAVIALTAVTYVSPADVRAEVKAAGGTCLWRSRDQLMVKRSTTSYPSLAP